VLGRNPYWGRLMMPTAHSVSWTFEMTGFAGLTMCDRLSSLMVVLLRDVHAKCGYTTTLENLLEIECFGFLVGANITLQDLENAFPHLHKIVVTVRIARTFRDAINFESSTFTALDPITNRRIGNPVRLCSHVYEKESLQRLWLSERLLCRTCTVPFPKREHCTKEIRYVNFYRVERFCGTCLSKLGCHHKFCWHCWFANRVEQPEIVHKTTESRACKIFRGRLVTEYIFVEPGIFNHNCAIVKHGENATECECTELCE
jgi:hypothetical protein